MHGNHQVVVNRCIVFSSLFNIIVSYFPQNMLLEDTVSHLVTHLAPVSQIFPNTFPNSNCKQCRAVGLAVS